MQHAIKRGKFYKDIFYPQEQQVSYQLHRDLKSSISLWKAQQLYNKHKEQLLSEDQTVFLEFLNNYPLSYNYRQAGSPIKMYYEILKMDARKMSIYEQQLKLSVMCHLKEYLGREDKQSIFRQIQKFELEMQKNIEHQPYDAVNSLNYIMLQKQSVDTVIFKHAIESLKQADSNIMIAIMPKATPGIIIRLTMNEWGTLRKFNHLLDFVVEQWVPYGLQLFNEVNLISIVATWQLHMIGYKNIPVCISLLIEKVTKDIKEKDSHGLTLLSNVFQLFKYLPLNYEEQSFRLIKDKIKQKIIQGKESFDILKLPLNRLKASQIIQFYELALTRAEILTHILYNGNHEVVKFWLKKSKAVQILFEQHCKLKVPSSKNFTILINSTTILIEKYYDQPDKIQKIMNVFKNIGNAVIEQTPLSRSWDITVIMNLLHLKHKFKLNWNVTHLFEEYVRNQKDLLDIRKIGNILKAVKLSHKTEDPELIKCINVLLKMTLQKTTKFNFSIFSQFIFLLAGRNSYRQVIDLMFKRLQDSDCPYFVELYNRYNSRDPYLTNIIFEKVSLKNSSFVTLAKFLVTENPFHLLNSEGQLMGRIAKTLEEIEPTITIQDLRQFMPLEVMDILKLCSYFYGSIKRFAKKVGLLSIGYFQHFNISKEGSKQALKFVEAITLLSLKEELQPFFKDKIIKMMEKIMSNSSGSPLVKTQELEIKWLLGFVEEKDIRQLAVNEVLDELRKRGYANSLKIILKLLKMYDFGELELSESLARKLSAIASEQVKSASGSVMQVQRSLNLLPNTPRIREQTSFSPFVSVITTALIKGTTNNYAYCEPYVKVAELTRNRALIQTLLKVVPQNLDKWQFIKIYNLIWVSLRMNLSESLGKIVATALKICDKILAYLPDLVYVIHYHLATIDKKDAPYFKQTKQLAEYFILGKLKDTEQKEGSRRVNHQKRLRDIIKLLWVRVKLDQYDETTFELYKHLLKYEKDIVSMPHKSFVSKIPWENIWQILAVLRIKAKETRIFRKDKGSFTHPEGQFSDTTIVADQKALSQKLKKAGLKQLTPDDISEQKDNYYAFNVKQNDVLLSVKAKKAGQQYGMLIVNENTEVDSEGKVMGRFIFKKQVFEVLTDLPIIPVRLQEEIKWE